MHLCGLGIKSLPTSTKELEKDFEKLKQIRNKLAHHGSLQLEEKEFENYWNTSEAILIKYGLTPEQIDEMDKLGVSSTVEIENNKKATELKEKGSAHLLAKEFDKAIEHYSEALQIENLGSEQLGALYSNRSAAFVALRLFNEAKDDAKCSINLRPDNAMGYYRLAVVYEKLEKYEQSLLNYRISLKKDPEYKKSVDGEAFCVLKIEKQNREEHLDPLQMIKTDASLEEDFKRKGMPIEKIPKEMIKILFSQDDPHLICAEAHKYLFGIKGMEQNFEKAAELYARAARKGNAEGMYNLALLTEEGNGVKRDFQKSTELLFQAASCQTPIISTCGIKTRHLGVAEAQHCLGLRYQEGVGFQQNYEKVLSCLI